MSEGEDGSNAEPELVKPKPDSGSGGPKWISYVTALVALLGTIAGICTGIWGLVEKSRADKEAAETNLAIAREKSKSDLTIANLNLQIAMQQLDAHKKEYEFQAGLHKEDQKMSSAEFDREQSAKDTQQLTSLINEILSHSTGTEGQLDLLSAYVHDNHLNDELIANAIVAKFGTMTSLSEMEMAFWVLEKMPRPYPQALIDINAKARERYDAALMNSFWLALQKRVSSLSPDFSNSVPGDINLMSVRFKLYRLIQDSEDDVMNAILKDPLNLTVRNQISSNYMLATLNRYVGQQVLFPYVYTYGDPKTYNEVVQNFFLEINVHCKSIGQDPAETRRFSVRVLNRTAKLIPVALRNSYVNKDALSFSLDRCFLQQELWPSGDYPTLLFGSEAYFREVDFKDVIFDDRTLATMMPHLIADQNNQFLRPMVVALFGSAGANDNFWTFSQSNSVDDLRMTPSMKQRLKTLVSKKKMSSGSH
jgi:hypothetical protein